MACVRLLLLVYSWFWTCVSWDICSFFSLWFFIVFKIFLALIILYCLKTCCIFDLYLFALARDRFFTVNIYFEETLFFNFSYKFLINISPYFRVFGQFRFSVYKWNIRDWIKQFGIMNNESFLMCSESKIALPQLFHEQ